MKGTKSIYISEDLIAIRAQIREYVEREIVPRAADWENGGVPREVLDDMGKLGFFGLRIPEEHGGLGMGSVASVVFAEELGRSTFGGFTITVLVHTDLATPYLTNFGSEEQKARWLASMATGETLTAIGVTEPDAGSDVAAIRTRAERDGDEWVINGSKMFITNAVQADWLCLLARTSDEGGYAGMSQIVVPTSSPGFEVSRKLDKFGMRASDTGLLSFSDCRVPVANTIGEPGKGFQQQMSQFVIERMWANYSTVPGIDLALARTADYLRQRIVFGKPLLRNHYVQYKLAELAAEVDLLRYYNYTCAEAYMAGADTTRFATIAKIKAGRLSREVADWCLQFHGGMGYMEETWTTRFLRDTRLTSIGAGSDETMLQVLARLDGFTA